MTTDSHFPRMPLRPRLIIQGVLNERCLYAEDFFSKFRDKHLVAARRDAALRMMAVGYTACQIGRWMRRNHSTILNYIEMNRDRKRTHHAGLTIMRHLAPEAVRIVIDYAKAEGVKPTLLIAQWINERATYEAQAKARAA